jgi:hypothetical protein
VTATVVDVDARSIDDAVPDVAQLRKGVALRRPRGAGLLTVQIHGHVGIAAQSMADFAKTMHQVSKAMGAPASSFRSLAQQMALFEKTRPKGWSDRFAQRVPGGSGFKRALAELSVSIDLALEDLIYGGRPLQLLEAGRRYGRRLVEGFAVGAGYRPETFAGDFARGGIVPSPIHFYAAGEALVPPKPLDRSGELRSK